MESETDGIISRGIDFLKQHTTGVWLATSLFFIFFSSLTGNYWLAVGWVFIGAAHLCEVVFEQPRATQFGLVLSLLSFVFIALSFTHPL